MSSSLTLQVADAVKDALGGEPAFRYSDAYGYAWWIHTKQVDTQDM